MVGSHREADAKHGATAGELNAHLKISVSQTSDLTLESHALTGRHPVNLNIIRVSYYNDEKED